MIKFVYFDLGGVVIRDFNGTNNWEELEEELGIPLEKRAEFEKFWDDLEPQMQVGLDIETLLPIIEKQFGRKMPPDYSLLKNGFINRFAKNETIWPVISEIQKTHKTGLLTNMYPEMFEAIKKRGLLPDVTWDIIVDSSVVHLQKPDPEIYKFAQVQANAKPEEILFIDNMERNTEAAKKVGWQVFLYDAESPQKASIELLRFWRNLDK